MTMSYRLTILIAVVAVSHAYTFTSMPSHQRRAFLSTWSKPVASKASNNLTMKLSKSGSKGGGDSVLSQKHSRRVSTAGRRGTKKFVDPNKLFVGNLPFDSTEDEVMVFFKEHLGNTRNIKSFKIIRDYRTGNSKGYGFVLFTDPMFATCAMEFCKGKQLKGRYVNLHQGQKKDDPNLLIVKKEKKKPVDEEESAIQAGIEDVEMEALLEDFDDASDEMLFDDEEDDSEYDGKFEELLREPLTEEEEKLNRKGRRKAQQRKKRNKMPQRGFNP